MEMLKRSALPLQVIFLLLLLLSSNNSNLFAANPEFSKGEIAEDYQDLKFPAVGEPLVNQFDSILPVQTNILFHKGNFAAVEDLRNHILYHTSTSQHYIKRSHFIFPALGVKEVIFPFHVFL